MSDPPVTHEELALALEMVRMHSLTAVALAMSAGDNDKFKTVFEAFEKRDDEMMKFIAAVRGEND